MTPYRLGYSKRPRQLPTKPPGGRRQPQDDVAVALAGLADGSETIGDRLRDVDEALPAAPRRDCDPRHSGGFRRCYGSQDGWISGPPNAETSMVTTIIIILGALALASA